MERFPRKWILKKLQSQIYIVILHFGFLYCEFYTVNFVLLIADIQDKGGMAVDGRWA